MAPLAGPATVRQTRRLEGRRSAGLRDQLNGLRRLDGTTLGRVATEHGERVEVSDLNLVEAHVVRVQSECPGRDGGLVAGTGKDQLALGQAVVHREELVGGRIADPVADVARHGQVRQERRQHVGQSERQVQGVRQEASEAAAPSVGAMISLETSYKLLVLKRT